MSGFNKEHLFNTHVVRVSLAFRLLNVVIKVHHFFHSSIKLSFVPHLQVVSGVFKPCNLVFDLVKLLTHLQGMLGVNLADMVKAFLELFLIFKVLF
jgi:hypothetical protein